MSYKLMLNIVISLMISICLGVTYLEPELSGKSTYYGGNPSGGACGYATVETTTFPFGYYAACGGAVFNSGYGCGKCYEITCIGPYSPNPSCHCSSTTPSVIISCMDQCPECSDTHFDLDPTAMARIVGPGLSGTCGVIETTVRRVSCEYITNIHIRAKSGTSSHWYGLHIDNIGGYGSVIAVQLKSNGDSTYDTTCDKSSGPSYWQCNGGFPLSVPMTVQLTNDNGDNIIFTDCITNFNGGAEFDCGANFDGGGTPTPTIITLSPTTKSPTTSPCGIRNIKFVSVTESELYWLAFYILDVCDSCGIISNVEIFDSSGFGSYVSGDNSDPRGFWAYDDVGMNHGGYAYIAPITVKIINSNNEILTFTDVLTSVNGDLTFNTNNNLCQSGTAIPTSVTAGPVKQPTLSPVSGPICNNDVKFRMQSGSQIWWLAFYVEDLCCGIVSKVEVKDYVNYVSYVTGVLSQYDYFQFDNADYGGQSFTAPITVRITNSNNEIIEFVDVIQSVDPGGVYYGNPNFCQTSPTSNPITSPTTNPNATPTNNPITSPTNNPVALPTSNPIASPTSNPVASPTSNPITSPTNNPVALPTNNPVLSPTNNPVPGPTSNPALSPTNNPITGPTNNPITSPTSNPITSPTNNPIAEPTDNPTSKPTQTPSKIPTSKPTSIPTLLPSNNPTSRPTDAPIIPGSPTKAPSNPTPTPTNHPSKSLTSKPTHTPTITPTNNPTIPPTNIPTFSPTFNPSKYPSNNPTSRPTDNPIIPGSPTKAPSNPTPFPTKTPINSPTNNPISTTTTNEPSFIPSTYNPSTSPTKTPSAAPTVECDDTCDDNDDNNNKKIKIKVIFWFPSWITYDLTHIRCWLYKIFIEWFINFEFVQYIDVCDINVIVIGGNKNTDNNCNNGQCLSGKNNIRRVLLQQNINEPNVSVSVIANDEDTLTVINALSIDSMSNQLHTELMNNFNVDIKVKVETKEEDENKESEENNDLNIGGLSYNMMELIIVGVLCFLFVCIVIVFGVFCYTRCKKRKQYTKKDIATGEMLGGGKRNNKGKMHQTNIISGEDDEDEYDADNMYALNKYPASYKTNMYDNL